jgi:YVTN family beta-propeller protein
MALMSFGAADTVDTHDPAHVADVTVGLKPQGLTVAPDGSAVFVANSRSNTVSVISTPANSVIATIAVGKKPMFVAVTPDGSTAFVSNFKDNSVSVISTTTKAVTKTIRVGKEPLGLAVKPDGSQLWVCNGATEDTEGNVSIIDIASLKTIKTIDIPVGQRPVQMVFTPDGTRAHVLNQGDLSDSGTQVQGYVTNIDVTGERILGERTFMQDNTVPSGIAVNQVRPQRFYVSCLQAEKQVIWFESGGGTLIISVFRGGPSNPKSRLAGIAGGGNHLYERVLFVADPGEDKLVRIVERGNDAPHTHGVWLGGNIKPVYVAVSPVLSGDAVHYVYTSNPSSGTVSVIDNLNIRD